MNARNLHTLPLIMVFTTALALAADPEPAPEKVNIPGSPAKAEERRGLEAGFWEPDVNSNPVEVKPVVAEEQPDNRMIRIEYKGGKSDKSAVKKHTGLAVAETGKLHAWIYSTEDLAGGVGIALVTGGDYNWQETEPTKLKKGWNEMSVDLAGKAWKSKATDWKFEATLQAREDVRAIVVNIYNGQASGTIYLDALQIDHTGDTAEIDKQVQNLTDAATRDEADKALKKNGRAAIESLNNFVETTTDKEAANRAIKILEHIGGKPDAKKKAE